MNYQAQVIRRMAHDFVVKMRLVFQNQGNATHIVDQLNADAVETIAGDVCATLGVDYEGPPDVPRRKSDGRPSPWARKGGAKAERSS